MFDHCVYEIGIWVIVVAEGRHLEQAPNHPFLPTFPSTVSKRLDFGKMGTFTQGSSAHLDIPDLLVK